jgi:chromosome partitioning protein
MPKIVAFMNKKGGVGKSSTVHHLGGTLARRGLKVLLVDVDSQANLTEGLLGAERTEGMDPTETLAAIMDESGAFPARGLVRPTAFPGLAIIPGSRFIDRFNVPEPWLTGVQQYVLRDALAEAGEGFDLVLIDCPPAVAFWSWSALVAADGVVIPCTCEDYGVKGLRAIRQTIARVRAEANDRLALLGILIQMFNKSLSVHVTYREALRGLHGADVFEAMVPLAADLKEAITLGRPIVEHKPRGAGAKAFAALADEFLARLDARAGGGTAATADGRAA